MQVRKFEAKNMKEALELVKQHLGPEAIILSAKDNNRGFGLMGQRSVEVTAAVSEETLQRKKLAEKGMREQSREKFTQSSARSQRQFINKSHQSRLNVTAETQRLAAAAAAQKIPREATSLRYIDIIDEEPASAAQRIREAALRARSVSQPVLQEPPRRAPTAAARPATVSPQVAMLEAQIGELKTMLASFQKMPQNMVSAHPGADEGVPYEFSLAYERLKRAGVGTQLAVEWMGSAKTEIDRESQKKAPLVDAWLVQKILRETTVAKDPMGGRYHVFLGTTAQGKTSTLVKMASHYVLKQKKRIALVSLDTLKVGASDQLKIYAQILNVPFAVVRTTQDWVELEKRLKGVEHVFVDAPGMNLKTVEEVNWIKSLLPPASQRRIHFVQSALARDEECFEIASRYRMIGFDDVIFTRLDESVQHGLILNFQKQFQTQLHSFGTGTRIPEDYEWATKERVADLIFKISKMRKREVAL
jgi:flagellar biosynthesis protein FlhF